jgi:hypothetical protein
MRVIVTKHDLQAYIDAKRAEIAHVLHRNKLEKS